MKRILLFSALLALPVSPALSQTRPPGQNLATASVPPKTAISNPERLIIATAFDQETARTRKGVIHGWQAAIGEWWVADGVLHGDQIAEDHHPSSCTFKTEATHIIITAQFRLGKAEQIAFGCRDNIPPHHHLARTTISKDAIVITHMSGIASSTKSEKAAELKTPIDPEAWYDLTIEILGEHYRAQIGSQVVEAQHARFADTKGLVALITKGEGAQFRRVSLWQSKPL